jgi:hypothetical protein
VTGDLHPHAQIGPSLRQPERRYRARDRIKHLGVRCRMLTDATVTAQSGLQAALLPERGSVTQSGLQAALLPERGSVTQSGLQAALLPERGSVTNDASTLDETQQRQGNT